MFNPATFTTAAVTSIDVCNSEHPLAKHIVGLVAKRIPSSKDVYYIRFVADKHVVTYRKSDHSVALFNLSFAEFKQHWIDKTLPFEEPLNVPDTDKYIGNQIWRYLADELK